MTFLGMKNREAELATALQQTLDHGDDGLKPLDGITEQGAESTGFKEIPLQINHDQGGLPQTRE
jgi:hypothetical protein